MKYLKKFNESLDHYDETNKELFVQLKQHGETLKKLEDQVDWSDDEIKSLNKFIKTLGNFDTATKENNVFIIKGDDINLSIYKLPDEWYIVSFENAKSKSHLKSSLDYLCDQLDSLRTLIKMSAQNNKIEIPFDYYYDTFTSIPSPVDNNRKLQAANILRKKLKKYKFKLTYDELMPTTTGSNQLKAWKEVEYSNLKEEAIEFFNILREPGIRIVQIEISINAFQNGQIYIHIKPIRNRRGYSIMCKSLDTLEKFLDDKLSLV